ncbi:hypothetical protein B0H14DRAFT_2625824 [Mycena olivaceomarginata]|nr:hypothetical protein B0H14DRAFT_2625824 [Mycena olivaceomarginata]
MPHIGRPCTPVFFDNDLINHRSHDLNADEYYYVVFIGRAPGIYFNFADGLKQVNKVTDAKWEKFRTKALALDYWASWCLKKHNHGNPTYKVTGLAGIFDTYDAALAAAGEAYITEASKYSFLTQFV